MNTGDIYKSNYMENIDESIIQTIVMKLGYSVEEVRKNARIENSFINVLYNKILQEQKTFQQNNLKSVISLSAKTNV